MYHIRVSRVWPTCRREVPTYQPTLGALNPTGLELVSPLSVSLIQSGARWIKVTRYINPRLTSPLLPTHLSCFTAVWFCTSIHNEAFNHYLHFAQCAACPCGLPFHGRRAGLKKRDSGEERLPGDDGFLDQFVVDDTDVYTTTDFGTPFRTDAHWRPAREDRLFWKILF